MVCIDRNLILSISTHIKVEDYVNVYNPAFRVSPL
jgi:hypothetical protein